ncbi:unnamed protein product [Clonostachys rhizophaga]|uniref:Uncharacterized protein n=1 Tax=Clonostachys rhizophaga TaxID=160324 RepID=A0A9N9VWZ5_9HYPO|nr:unnamed protein product [Clonostachys rhizophaga]
MNRRKTTSVLDGALQRSQRIKIMDRNEPANDGQSDGLSESRSYRSYDGEPTIRYNVEWKLFVKNRGQAGESELDIVISPHKFWKHVLLPKMMEASANKPWAEDATKLILSVTDRRTSKITKRFPKLNVDWRFVGKQLQEWSHFINDGKRITATITFYYQHVESNSTSGRGGATANQEADLEARTSILGRGKCIRQAYALMRCPGPPCTEGDHCWQYEGRHYPLRPHHVRMLADHMQAGRTLNGHDDVPDDFRRLVLDDQREREERERKEQSRKRRRRNSDDAPSMLTGHCYYCATGGRGTESAAPLTPAMVFPTFPLTESELPKEDEVNAYSVWQRSLVRNEERKEQYRLAEELTLERCFDLDMLASNQERIYRLYVRHGIAEGIAWRYISDIRSYLDQRKGAEPIS